MAISIKSPIEEIFEIYKHDMEPIVGEGNCTMEEIKTIAKFKKFARLLYLGSVHRRGDLEGDECAVDISFQTECFACGTKALSLVFEIDYESHKSMVNMGFRRTYQSLIENIDSRIKRVVSRYSRLYTGQLPKIGNE